MDTQSNPLNSSLMKLSLACVEIRIKTNVATELRDNIEALCSGSSYPTFLAKMWPVFKNILKGDPVFTNVSYEQVRNCCVRVLCSIDVNSH